MNNKKPYYKNIFYNIRNIFCRKNTKIFVRYYVLIPLIVLVIIWQDYYSHKSKDILFDILSILLTIY
jgi:hypothetical protein